MTADRPDVNVIYDIVVQLFPYINRDATTSGASVARRRALCINIASTFLCRDDVVETDRPTDRPTGRTDGIGAEWKDGGVEAAAAFAIGITQGTVKERSGLSSSSA